MGGGHLVSTETQTQVHVLMKRLQKSTSIGVKAQSRDARNHVACRVDTATTPGRHLSFTYSFFFHFLSVNQSNIDLNHAYLFTISAPPSLPHTAWLVENPNAFFGHTFLHHTFFFFFKCHKSKQTAFDHLKKNIHTYIKQNLKWQTDIEAEDLTIACI